MVRHPGHPRAAPVPNQQRERRSSRCAAAVKPSLRRGDDPSWAAAGPLYWYVLNLSARGHRRVRPAVLEEIVPISVILPDQSSRELPDGASTLDLAKAISNSLARKSVAAKVNGEVVDLTKPLADGDKVEILTTDSPESLDVLRHSTAHIMASAVQALFPGAQVTIGPVTADGFFYDFNYERPFTPEDLVAIEGRMKTIVDAKQAFSVRTVAKSEAKTQFSHEPFKQEIMDDIIKDDVVTLYAMGDFTDVCRGPHLPNTEFAKAFKLLSVAGAYWRGDEKRPMLQRIYGTSYFKKEDLELHLHRLEEAEKRNHRKLGKELELFMFNESAPGMPFFLPKGAFVYNRFIDYIRDLYVKYGYDEVITPLTYNPSMFQTSGHLGNYNENMYRTWTEDLLEGEDSEHKGCLHDHSQVLKPMNCPSHCLIFGSKKRSYRELPWRVADFARLHRYERGGVLHGLARVRSFAQDDAHIFCTEDQVPGEIEKFIAFLYEVYTTLKFDKIDVKLATRPEKRIGTDEAWDKAEAALELGLKNAGLPFEMLPGEGAFYGPKIEFHVQDAIGRSWQLGTIQHDPNLPERFDLTYVGDDGKDHRPVMLHRAVLGSLERFFAVYLEHCGGAFPVWLAPVQAMVLPISEDQAGYAREIAETLVKAGLRAKCDNRNESLNYRIREAQMTKIPYTLVVGKREMEERSVAIRPYGETKNQAMTLAAFVKRLKQESDPDAAVATEAPDELKQILELMETLTAEQLQTLLTGLGGVADKVDATLNELKETGREVVKAGVALGAELGDRLGALLGKFAQKTASGDTDSTGH
ncbi:MAG: threonine--tRNA ligase [Candidatus Sericytochromatia bacterium]|nr:threonine--tRNA ligase [Candidatus Sericytochromatia bacterium]